MDGGYKLVLPDLKHEGPWRIIVNDFKRAGENIVPYALSYGCDNYKTYLETVRAFHTDSNLPPDRVPSSTYFLTDEDEKVIYGAINIRHRLNKELVKVGGHIGYGIAPVARRRGLATKQLGMALEICREMGIGRVLITCEKGNVGSAKTAIKNGGVLENELIDLRGKIIQRYWIDLNNEPLAQ